MSPRRWIPALAVLAYVLAFVVFRLGDPDLAPWGGDTSYYNFQAMAFLRSSLFRGELPLWNPYQFAGTPFMALQGPGVFNPLVVACALLPPHMALVAHMVVHLLLAAGLMWLFARRIGVGGPGSIVSCVVLVGSYQMTTAANQIPAYLSTFAWLPGLFLMLHLSVHRPTLGNGLLFALVLAMAFMGGHSQALLYFVQAGALYVLFLLAQIPGWAERGRAVALLLGFGVVALGLIAIQLVPSLEYAAGATRDLGGMALGHASFFRLPNERIAEALLGVGKDWLALPFLFVPLSLVALTRRSTRAAAGFFLLLFIGVVDFMRGMEGFVYPIHFALPFGDLFRIPLRIGLLAEFAAAILLGFGVTNVLAWLEPRRKLALPAATLLPLCIAGDVFLRNVPPFVYQPLVDPEAMYGPRRLVDFVPQIKYDRMFVFGLGGPMKFGQTHETFEVTGYEPALPGAYASFFDIPPDRLWHGQLDVVPSNTGGRDNGWFVQDPALLDFLSVRYYVDSRSTPQRLRKPVAPIVSGRKLGEGTPEIHERVSALPRTYLVHDVLQAPSDAQALVWMRSGSFDKRRSAIVHDAIEPLEPRPPGAVESARIVEYRPGEVSLEARCASACLLILTDFFDPNWQAFVDDEIATQTRANYLVRGVRLAAGEHRVRFVYAPASLRIGAAISFGTVLLLTIVVGGTRIRRSRFSSGRSQE